MRAITAYLSVNCLQAPCPYPKTQIRMDAPNGDSRDGDGPPPLGPLPPLPCWGIERGSSALGPRVMGRSRQRSDGANEDSAVWHWDRSWVETGWLGLRMALVWKLDGLRVAITTDILEEYR